MPLAKEPDHKVSEEDYLKAELISEVRHEYSDGYVYAMSGGSANHNLITGNVLRKLGNGLEANKSPCDIFSSDMKVRIGKEIAYVGFLR